MLAERGPLAVTFVVSVPKESNENKHWVKTRVFGGVTPALLQGKSQSTKPSNQPYIDTVSPLASEFGLFPPKPDNHVGFS